MEGRTVAYSAVTMSQLMLPNQANPMGNVHGGEIMKIMDMAAGVVATRHAHANTVTARGDAMNFYLPIYVGNLVTVSAHMTFASRRTMEVEVRVIAEDVVSGKKRQALSAYFVMVALDQKNKPKEVPPLIVKTNAEKRRYEEGLKRYEERKSSPQY